MKVPFNDPARQYFCLQNEIDNCVQNVLTGGYYIMGPEHDLFEAEFASYCQRQYGIAVNNGTDALEIALRTVGCAPGDEVITVANAGGYTLTACIQIGAVPVFVDVKEEDLTMSPSSVARALGEKTRAIVITHLYGKLADTEGIKDLTKNRQIAIIEDCAQAHGATWNGKTADSYSDVAAYSFYPTKNLGAIGDGGIIITDNPDYAQKAKRLRQYGWQEKYHINHLGGRNSRMDELQAAILRRKLPLLDSWNSKRRDIVDTYQNAAAGTNLKIIHNNSPDFVAHLCIGRHPERDTVRKELLENGIATAIHYPVLDSQQAAIKSISWRAMDLAVSGLAQNEILSLPCFPEMSDEEIGFVGKCIKKYC